MNNQAQISELSENLLNVKVAQLHVKWLQDAMSHIDKSNPGDPVYKICCCYHVFSKAAHDYKNIPYSLEVARYYAFQIIDFIEEQTGEKIRELSDRINGHEGSIPTNLLYWCDAIDAKREEIYYEVWEFIYLSIENLVPILLSNPEKRLNL